MKKRERERERERERVRDSYGFSRQVESQRRCFHFGAVQ